jgi:hypothetical protein
VTGDILVTHSRSCLLLLAVAVCADSRAEITLKHALLQINGASPSNTVFLIAPPEEDALAPLPALDAEKEEEGSDENNAPLPADALVPEHSVVDDRNVEDGEDGDEPEHDRQEQELVPPDVNRPLSEVIVRIGLHHEERAAHVQHLPCEEEREPRKAGEGGCPSAEDGVASVIVRFVTIVAEVAVAETKHDDGEGCQTEGSDPQAIHNHVDHDFDGENTALELQNY